MGYSFYIVFSIEITVENEEISFFIFRGDILAVDVEGGREGVEKNSGEFLGRVNCL